MKLVSSILFTVILSSVAFANEPTTATSPAATAAPTAAEVAATATETKKMTKKEAKMACKSEGKKGKELKSCMKSKMM